MGEIKPDLHTYELRLVIVHMTVYILPVAIKFFGFYLMTIEDTTISYIDLRKHSYIKYNSDINSSPFVSRQKSIFIAISTIVLLAVQNK